MTEKGHVDWQCILKVLPLLERMKIICETKEETYRHPLLYIHIHQAVIFTLSCHHSLYTITCVPRSENGGSEELPRHADTTREDTTLFSNRGLYWAAEGRSWHRVVGGMTFSHICLEPWPSLKGTWCRVFLLLLYVWEARAAGKNPESERWGQEIVLSRGSWSFLSSGDSWVVGFQGVGWWPASPVTHCLQKWCQTPCSRSILVQALEWYITFKITHKRWKSSPKCVTFESNVT